ncbi:electron transfer flavoprotein subunit alpha/FixB family protein [Elusimicrobiota bacterium]
MSHSIYKPEEAKGVWVYLEHNGKELENVSLELLNKGKELAKEAKEPLVGLIMGHNIESLAKEVYKRGAEEVIIADHPLLRKYTTDAFTQAAYQVVTSKKPNILLIGATPDGRDLAGRLAVKFKTGLSADCTNFEIKHKDNKPLLLSEVTGFGGGIAAMIACEKDRPQMATVRPGVFEQAKSNGSNSKTATKIDIMIDEKSIRTQVIERKIGGEVDITKAKFLVVAGRGIAGNVNYINALAKAIGAEIGATRVATDEGWIEKERMVGQTGVVTRPKVAIVCGVSGAMQFTVGIQNAETVVSINTDPEAPIFEASDYCVNADLFQVLPPLIEELKKVK